ncbi:GNAT family N-acetyltransferase [Paenirhodobacter sp.]|uniref:GNAT family N-acetyltransferase n=1 Tax=Paenirhodobacter sp. TaxID=1965326 RepID=UPI003B418A16
MVSDLDIRPLRTAEQKAEGFSLFRSAMLGLPDFDALEPGFATRFLAEGVGYGAYDGDNLIAAVNGYGSEIAVPGGNWVRHLGVTHVGVAPEATRRGIARRMIVHQLRAALRDGYVVAGLRASDARIYGRYGYGVGSWSVRQELDLKAARLLLPSAIARRVSPDDFALFRAIVTRAPASRPAQLQRWDGWWAVQEFRLRHATTPHHAVVFGAPGEERGLLRFHVEPVANWFTASNRSVIIDDLVAHDAEAWRALIGHLFSQDILHRSVFPSRPVDDPLGLLLDNPRAVSISEWRDESWLRILDLRRLLDALPFEQEATLAIRDSIFPENDGIWRIGRRSEKTTAAPEAEISIAYFASLAFGAVSVSDFRQVGRIRVHTEDIGRRLEKMFTVGAKPHAGISF